MFFLSFSEEKIALVLSYTFRPASFTPTLSFELLTRPQQRSCAREPCPRRALLEPLTGFRNAEAATSAHLQSWGFPLCRRKREGEFEPIIPHSVSTARKALLKAAFGWAYYLCGIKAGSSNKRGGRNRRNCLKSVARTGKH